MLAAAWSHRADIGFAEPLTRQLDIDGYDKLTGIARDPSVRALLGYFIGDDPQRVHTFRPLPAAMLWLQWHLWGFTRWPYLLVNLALYGWLGLRLVRLTQRFGQPRPVAAAVGLMTMLVRTSHTVAILHGIATLHDLLAALVMVVAADAALAYLAGGERRALFGCLTAVAAGYLCKESALAMVPLLAVTAWLAPPGEPLARRRWALAVVAVGTAVGWFVWYRLAEQNMIQQVDAAHSFVGLWRMLLVRWLFCLVNFLFVLCQPIGELVYAYWSGPPAAGLLTLRVYDGLFTLALLVPLTVTLWRHDRRLLLFAYAWRVAHMLPVLPLNNTWPWYHFAPKIADALLYVPALAVLARAWLANPRPLGRLLAWRAICFAGALLAGGATAWRWQAPEVALFDLIALAWLSIHLRPSGDAGLSEHESGR